MIIGEADSDPDAACAVAVRLQLAGDLEGARETYLKILEKSPAHGAAHYCLGMLYVQSRQAAQGLVHLHAALKADPGIADYWLGYADALLLSGQTAAAREVVTLAQRQGVSGEALATLAGRIPQAEGSDRRPHDNEPQAEESRLLGLVSQRKLAEAMGLAQDLVRRHPGRGLAWKVLGALMWAESPGDASLAVLREAVRVLPEDAEVHMNLALALFQTERLVESQALLERATELAPELAQAHFMLAVNYLNQGAVARAEAGFRRGLALRSDWTQRKEAESYSNLLLSMAHNPALSAASLFAEHRAYGSYFDARFPILHTQRPRERRPGKHLVVERRLKVGIVSGDLCNHSVGMFLAPVLGSLTASDGLELHAYDTNPKPQQDAVAAQLQAAFHRSSAVASLSDADIARRINDDCIDLLIDLSGHTANGRLPVFAHRPAPLQLSWLGYPGTTGLKAMDYYVADTGWLPPGRFDQQFTEKLVYLPDRWAFQVHAAAPRVGELPALRGGALTLGSFHRTMKLTDETLDLWSQALRAIPTSRLLLAGIAPGGCEERLRERFAALGIPATRLLIHGRGTMDAYLELHQQVDLALDSLAYAGATTTMHSLSMGVPTLTVDGATPQSRAGVGILANIQLDGFVAADAADFVARARYWAAHLDELAGVRATLRERLLRSSAANPALIAKHLEQAMRHMWRRWCAGLPAESFSSTLAGMEER
jgi:predicted O-linked N-acetylglucosamine transferase (SPINDLY family)